ncbi:MAG TPA: hypothetical protein VFM46_18800 [Pseudomonadales bacterium]|nr:hypothetical protein [Pseudomonadales bacterium]
MDSCFLSQQYEFVQRITEQMLAESALNNWQRVYELDQQRAQVLANMSTDEVKQTLTSLDFATAEKIRQCIQTVLSSNSVLVARAEQEKSNTQAGIHSTAVAARLNRTYSSSF